MTFRELARRQVERNGMTSKESGLMLEAFARGPGRDLPWDIQTPQMSRIQMDRLMDRIDRAAVNWRMANGVEEAAVIETPMKLPLEQVHRLADPTRNGPLVVALAREVLEARGVEQAIEPQLRLIRDGKMLATGE